MKKLFVIVVMAMQFIAEAMKLEINSNIYEIYPDGIAHCKTGSGLVAVRNALELDGERLVVKKIFFDSSKSLRVIIPENVESIGKKSSPYYRNPHEVIFEANSQLKRIERGAFYDSGLRSIRIPANVEVVGPSCFMKCQDLREVIFEKNSQLKRVERRAFFMTNLKSMRIPANVEVIGQRCFHLCNCLKEIIFERNSQLKTIVRLAFANSGLESICIPENVEVIGKGCFIGCRKLHCVVFETDPKRPPQIGKDAFKNCDELQQLIVPADISGAMPAHT
jgi:hypothetical protein